MFATLFPWGGIHAEEIDPFALSPEQLFGATVTSVSKREETWWNSPAAIYVLSNEDIRRSGATSIPEALRLVPGIQVTRYNTSGWAITVRGFNGDLTNKLLVLMDGREVYNHLFSGVYWDVQDTVLEDIDRIEVIRGPGAALWGANAVNGVINIITRKASDTQGEPVSVIAGADEVHTTIRHGGRLENGAYYRLYGKVFERDALKPLPGNERSGDWNQGRGSFRMDWDRDTQNSLTLQGDAYGERVGQFQTLSFYTAPYSGLTQETLEARGANLLGRWHHTRENGETLTTQFYMDYQRRESLLLTDETTAFDLDSQYEFSPAGRHQIIAGARLRQVINELTGSSQASFGENWRNDTLISGFVQDKITLQPEHWYLTLGSKFEHNDFTGFEVQPNARLQFHPNERQMVWASVARSVRVPSVLERDATITLAILPPSPDLPFPLSVPVVPSPDLDSEEMIAYELGYRHRLTPKLMLDTTAFYNDYADLAANVVLPFSFVNNGVDPLHVELPVQIQNLTEGKTFGVETVLDWQALRTLDVSASYSFLKMMLKGDPLAAIEPEAAEGRSPRHQFNLRSQWDVTDNTELDAMLYYVSKLPDFGIENYWRFDLRWGWQIVDQLRFDLVGQNLFYGNHQEFSIDTSARNIEISPSIYGKVTWRF